MHWVNGEHPSSVKVRKLQQYGVSNAILTFNLSLICLCVTLDIFHCNFSVYVNSTAFPFTAIEIISGQELHQLV